jgi:hypothetical protein
MGIGSGSLWQGVRGNLRKTRIEAPANKMILRIVFDHNEVDFFAGPDEKTLSKCGNSDDLGGYNHTTFGGFFSLRLALYVSGDGNAVFRNFRYRKLSGQ